MSNLPPKDASLKLIMCKNVYAGVGKGGRSFAVYPRRISIFVVPVRTKHI